MELACCRNGFCLILAEASEVQCLKDPEGWVVLCYAMLMLCYVNLFTQIMMRICVDLAAAPLLTNPMLCKSIHTNHDKQRKYAS